MRKAYTLIEITMATVILSTVMAIVLQFTVSARTHEASAAAQDDLAEDVLKISAALSDDFSLSGWHIPDGNTSGSAAGLGEKAIETALGSLTDQLDVDRRRRYYPYVIGEGEGIPPGGATANMPRGNATFFNHAALATAIKPDLVAAAAYLETSTSNSVGDLAQAASGATGVLPWYGTFAKESQSLILLRCFTYDGTNALEHSDVAREAKYQAYMNALGMPQIRFGGTTTADRSQWSTAGNNDTLGILHASGIYEDYGNWIARIGDDTPYGVHLESGYVTTARDGSLKVYPQWETVDPPNHERPADEEEWREYLYTVVRSPRSNRLGRMVRAHKHRLDTTTLTVGSEIGNSISSSPRTTGSGQYVYVIDRVLSDNVVRVVFDTYRTDRIGPEDSGRLDVNQIRARLYMARPDLRGDNRVITRVVSLVLTMRAKNTSEQRNEDAALLRALTSSEFGEFVNPSTSTTRREILADKVRDSRVGFPR